MFVISGAVSILTFKNNAGLSPTNTVGLFVVLYLLNGICLLIYVIMQVILVANTLQDRWPLGDIAFGVFFFVVGQVILYILGQDVCEGIQHYLDGLFFATILNLLAVMMVYKVCYGEIKHETVGKLVLMVHSIGILSQKRTSNSALAQKATGRSKSFCPKKTGAQPSTKTEAPNMPVACIIKRRLEVLITEGSIDDSMATSQNCIFTSLHGI